MSRPLQRTNRVNEAVRVRFEQWQCSIQPNMNFVPLWPAISKFCAADWPLYRFVETGTPELAIADSR